MLHTGKNHVLLLSLCLCYTVPPCVGIPDISFLLEAGNSLIDLVLSDGYEDLFGKGDVEVDGYTLYRYIESHTKITGPDFEVLFAKMLGEETLEGLKNKKYNWEKATDVINALIKLSDNLSVNASRRPGSEYKQEDDRITEAKKLLKNKFKGAVKFSDEL